MEGAPRYHLNRHRSSVNGMLGFAALSVLLAAVLSDAKPYGIKHGGDHPIVLKETGEPVPLDLAMLSALGGHIQSPHRSSTGGGYSGPGLASGDVEKVLEEIAAHGNYKYQGPDKPESHPSETGSYASKEHSGSYHHRDDPHYHEYHKEQPHDHHGYHEDHHGESPLKETEVHHGESYGEGYKGHKDKDDHHHEHHGHHSGHYDGQKTEEGYGQIPEAEIEEEPSIHKPKPSHGEGSYDGGESPSYSKVDEKDSGSYGAKDEKKYHEHESYVHSHHDEEKFPSHYGEKEGTEYHGDDKEKQPSKYSSPHHYHTEEEKKGAGSYGSEGEKSPYPLKVDEHSYGEGSYASEKKPHYGAGSYGGPKEGGSYHETHYPKEPSKEGYDSHHVDHYEEETHAHEPEHGSYGDHHEEKMKVEFPYHHDSEPEKLPTGSYGAGSYNSRPSGGQLGYQSSKGSYGR